MVPRSFLLFISIPSSIMNPNGWSLISKLMLTRSIASRKGHRILNEVGSVDLALKSLHDHIKNNDVRVGVEMASQRLKTLDSSIERLETGFDGRQMDKSWMKQSRTSSAYFKGVEEFLDFAFANAFEDDVETYLQSEPCNAQEHDRDDDSLLDIKAENCLILTLEIENSVKATSAYIVLKIEMVFRAQNSGQNMTEKTAERSNVQTDTFQFDGSASGQSNPTTVELGHEPSRMNMFIECYSKKDENGTPSTVEAANYMAQMHEKRRKLPDGSQDLPAENDILAQVVGKEKYGRVQMYGLGVSQSDVRDVVCLKSIMNPSEIVAKGVIQSIDPSTQVGGEELGPNWCEVSIQFAVKKDERLIRSYGFHKTIYDAYGATIAWPCPYVKGMNCKSSTELSQFFLFEASGDSEAASDDPGDAQADTPNLFWTCHNASIAREDDAESFSCDSRDIYDCDDHDFTESTEEDDDLDERPTHAARGSSKGSNVSREEGEEESRNAGTDGITNRICEGDETESNRLFWETCLEVGYSGKS
ncbi:hypothetical protein RJ639_027530 [Escallonia herrerae]|uniref:Transposase Tnp1/En/Spm-like domain-containing protein n=1 Tax=Escallonia herrerae TaxID=1293975 RepID=A0AA89BEC6_9ASTE|nr:hypothetical protein RJ639_027530 [Escallonia herrerae]